MSKVTLLLSDGTSFEGTSFGYEQPVSGEVVFNTAMVGYPESLTDPSYAGQIMVLTFPLVGNYGVPDCSLSDDGIALFMESERVHAAALIVSEYSEQFSHWNARCSLGDWLRREHIPAVTGIDTRALTLYLREHGVMMGQLIFEEQPTTPTMPSYEDIHFVSRVSCQQIIRYHEGTGPRVVLLDCGVKHNILRCLINRGVELIRVPWNYDFNTLDFDGLFLSNGPGDPNQCDIAVRHLRSFLDTERHKPMDRVRPIMGICLGNQLLGKAVGANIYKLKYGHRSANQPVRMEGTDHCFITSQNHGYALSIDTLPADWEPLFTNMNDASNEGIRHRSLPWFSVQFHPEACAGPNDTEFLFDDFIRLIKQYVLR